MIRIALFQGDQQQGLLKFGTLLVEGPTDYAAEPEDILTLEEVKQLTGQLRQIPMLTSGTVGKYHWRDIS